MEAVEFPLSGGHVIEVLVYLDLVVAHRRHPPTLGLLLTTDAEECRVQGGAAPDSRLGGMFHWINDHNANVWTAWATVATAAIAALAALVALRQLGQIRRDSRDKARPYVQVDVVAGLHGPGSWDLIIENTGASAAVEVTIDAGELTPADAKDHISADLAAYLNAPHTLVPGARRRVMWAYDTNNTRAGVLRACTARIRYFDERTAKHWWTRLRPYRATYLLEDPIGGNPYPAPTEGPVPNNSDMLQHINRALRTLNIHVGELRR